MTIRVLSMLATEANALRVEVNAILQRVFKPVGPVTESRLLDLVLQAQPLFQA